MHRRMHSAAPWGLPLLPLHSRVGFQSTVATGTYPGWEAQGGWVPEGPGSRAVAAGAGRARLAWLAAWLQVAAPGRGPTAAKRTREGSSGTTVCTEKLGSPLCFGRRRRQPQCKDKSPSTSLTTARRPATLQPRPAPPHLALGRLWAVELPANLVEQDAGGATLKTARTP